MSFELNFVSCLLPDSLVYSHNFFQPLLCVYFQDTRLQNITAVRIVSNEQDTGMQDGERRG